MQHDHSPFLAFFATWLPVLILSSLLIAYLLGVWQHRRTGKKWNSFRTLFIIMGIVLCMVALAPPLTDYAHKDLRGHMLQHLLIGMLAPLGLVLAAPLTLALRVLPVSLSRKITALLASKPIKVLCHPLTAFLLNIGGMYALYLTSLYVLMQQSMLLHYIMHIHFLAAGYLFVWSIAGPDPAPERPSFLLRLVVLFISMAAHAYLSKAMFAYRFPRNTTHSLAEIEEAAQLMYYGGDMAEVLLAIAFFALWYRRKARKPLLQPV